MSGETLIAAADNCLGVAYLGWVAAALVAGRRARRSGRGRPPWVKRMRRAGVLVGLAVLLIGLAGWWKGPPIRAAGKLVWPGAVYLVTAWVMSIPGGRGCRPDGGSGTMT